MPAARLGAATTAVNRFDLLGIDAAAPVGFVRHVGLAGESRGDLQLGDSSLLVHMVPPLKRDAGGTPVHVWGTIPLTVDEELRVNLFIDERIVEHEACDVRRKAQYVARPHALPHKEADGTTLFWRYSCVGFVVEAYRAAGLNIVSTDEARLPPIELETICHAYPFARGMAEYGQFGLAGVGPWPVLLAGHVFHALNRASDEIRSAPYEPQPGDEYFPSTRLAKLE